MELRNRTSSDDKAESGKSKAYRFCRQSYWKKVRYRKQSEQAAHLKMQLRADQHLGEKKTMQDQENNHLKKAEETIPDANKKWRRFTVFITCSGKL